MSFLWRGSKRVEAWEEQVKEGECDKALSEKNAREQCSPDEALMGDKGRLGYGERGTKLAIAGTISYAMRENRPKLTMSWLRFEMIQMLGQFNSNLFSGAGMRNDEMKDVWTKA